MLLQGNNNILHFLYLFPSYFDSEVQARLLLSVTYRCPQTVQKSSSHLKTWQPKSDMKQVPYWWPANITHHHTKFRHLGHLGICVPLLIDIADGLSLQHCKYILQYWCHFKFSPHLKLWHYNKFWQCTTVLWKNYNEVGVQCLLLAWNKWKFYNLCLRPVYATLALSIPWSSIMN